MSSKKPRVAIVSLTSCEGCQFAFLDMIDKFLDLAKRIDLDEFRLVEEERERGLGYDIAFVEGNAVTKDNIKTLKKLRKNSKTLVVLGNCAALGGVWEAKNYKSKQKTIRSVYKHWDKIENYDIKEVDNFVKVDYTIPGCPINAEEFFQLCYNLLDGYKDKDLQFNRRPVCSECQINGYECLLQKGDPCMGPISVGGCEAVCPGAGMFCEACRGILPQADIKKFINTLKKLGHSQERINNVLEKYGVRDHVEERLLKESKKK